MHSKDVVAHTQRYVAMFLWMFLGFLYISLISQWLTVSIVVQIYEFDGETRFVVRFEDGSESVFFAFELVAADKAAGQAG